MALKSRRKPAAAALATSGTGQGNSAVLGMADDLRLRQIYYFLEVVKSGAFLRASERLHVSQPALTTAVHKLEEMLGSKLLTRGHSGVRLTQSGKIFHASAQSIMQEYLATKSRLGALFRLESGQVNLGALPIVSTGFLPAALARFKTTHPNVGVTLYPSYNEMLLPSLKLGELDFVIGLESGVDTMTALTFNCILKDEICFVAKPEHRLASVRLSSPKEITDFIIFVPHPYREMHQYAMELFAGENGGFPYKYIEAYYYMAPEFLQLTDAIALLPLTAVLNEVAEGRLIVLNADFALPICRIGIIRREDQDLQEPARRAMQEIAWSGERLKHRMEAVRREKGLKP